MLYSYKECLSKYGTDYRIKQQIKKNTLFMKEKGIYSDLEYVPELDIITKKYPKAILTLNSAFYYYGLTDTIPEYYYMATKRGKKKITDKRVKQTFENSEGFELGEDILQYNSSNIRIYNRERLLVELIRNKNKISFDLYKEVIDNYRKIIHELDIATITEYASMLPKMNMVMDVIQMEVL